MATCSFGASGFKIASLNSGSHRPGFSYATLQFHLNGLRLKAQKSLVLQDAFVISQRSKKVSFRCRCSGSEAQSAAKNSEDDSKETSSPATVSKLIPNSFEVESLVSGICDTTSIAEFELKLGGFRLYVSRDLSGQTAATPPPVSAPVSVSTVADVPHLNGSASSLSLAISKPASPSVGVQTLMDKAADEGLAILQSPKVGFFRRSRTIKGKRAPPSCKEKQIVKEGQVLCYIEQLGGEIPIESDISGEVIKILREDGDPVGYGDALIAILPSFPGIKKLQ